MSKKTPKELYDEWLRAKDRVHTMILRASGATSGQDSAQAIDNLSEVLNAFVEQTRTIFNHDENRIRARDHTIAHLQDLIAGLESKDLKG